MTLDNVIKILKKHKPKNATEARRAGIALRYINRGAFREVYRLSKLPTLVIKFPYALDGYNIYESIEHANMEVQKIKKLYRFSTMQPMLPNIFYHDRDTGVVITEYFPEHKQGMAAQLEEALSTIQSLINALTKQRVTDLHRDNVRFTEEGIKLIDLGYVSDEYDS